MPNARSCLLITTIIALRPALILFAILRSIQPRPPTFAAIITSESAAASFCSGPRIPREIASSATWLARRSARVPNAVESSAASANMAPCNKPSCRILGEKGGLEFGSWAVGTHVADGIAACNIISQNALWNHCSRKKSTLRTMTKGWPVIFLC